jgi:hypothetical protein
MSGFKMKQSDQLVLKQRGGVVVFLESEEDFQIIAKRWFFDEGQDVLFQPADTYKPGPGGGGCKAVIDLVAQARACGISAFGLVDRDVLLNDHNWPLWWQDQDAAFIAVRPYGDHIRILLRWELENYLLDPDAMATVTNDAKMTSTHTAHSVGTSCLGCANELKDRSAATVSAIAERLTPPAAGFGCNPPLQGAALMVALHSALSKQGMANPQTAIANERQRIDQFDAPTAPVLHRWDRLVRMLDGKAALKYIGHRAGIRFDERRADLARRMREQGAVPSEIRRYIQEFKRAA